MNTIEHTDENYRIYKDTAEDYQAINNTHGYLTHAVSVETPTKLWQAIREATPDHLPVSVAEWEVGVYNPFREQISSFKLEDMSIGNISFQQLARLISAKI